MAGDDDLGGPSSEIADFDTAGDCLSEEIGEFDALRDLGQFLVAQMRVQKRTSGSRVDDPRPFAFRGGFPTRVEEESAGVLVRQDNVAWRGGFDIVLSLIIRLRRIALCNPFRIEGDDQGSLEWSDGLGGLQLQITIRRLVSRTATILCFPCLRPC